jgi:tRNA nucleotidyltransferase (CCA-adding enzyme)
MTVRIYRVGGAVRDIFMNMPSHDIDYAVEAGSYDEMREYIISHGGTIYMERPEFVTIRGRVSGVDADFVMCRRDGSYSDGRHPDRVEAGTIIDDLSRRDFTMNAIAIDEDGNFIDPFNGVRDIEDRIIRCVGNAHDRMSEDYLRMARAFRFSITRHMNISDDIVAMFDDPEMIDNFAHSISRERVREEINRAFACDTVASIMFFAAHPAFADACFGDDIWMTATNARR